MHFSEGAHVDGCEYFPSIIQAYRIYYISLCVPLFYLKKHFLFRAPGYGNNN